MAKAGPKTRPAEERAATRARMVGAAIETLKDNGYAGTSARAIAARGGFSQAAVFYHFGSVEQLLLAALDETSTRRMERYSAAVEGARTVDDLVAVAAAVYREDLAAGHLTVLAELIAGAAASPALGPEIVARIELWIRFTHDTVVRAVEGTPLAELVPAGDAAFAIVALYLGVELLTHLEGDARRAESLFGTAARLGGLLTALLGQGGGRATGDPARQQDGGGVT